MHYDILLTIIMCYYCIASIELQVYGEFSIRLVFKFVSSSSSKLLLKYIS